MSVKKKTFKHSANPDDEDDRSIKLNNVIRLSNCKQALRVQWEVWRKGIGPFWLCIFKNKLAYHFIRSRLGLNNC